MNKDIKKIAVLGSTGSVGRQTIEALDGADCEFVLLTGGKNTELLAEQARYTSAKVCCVASEDAASDLRLRLAGEDVKVYGGESSITDAIAECCADVVFHSIAGMAGIPSAIEASKTGCRLAIANKESVISVGDELFKNIRQSNGELIPVDSEHSAIFQCLTTSGAIDAKGNSNQKIVKRILLTASGGPFFGMRREELDYVTPKMALAHPTWRMGQKITIDCATLMNKGFEIIEASRLFGVDIDKIEVVIHRQSIIHSMVEYIDNMVIAQLGEPDMRHCIRYAMSYPERMMVEGRGLDFSAVSPLTFDSPDDKTFPLLGAARRAGKAGGTAPAALIASDEEAVASFIAGEIGFNDISDVVCEAIENFKPCSECTPLSVAEADAEARTLTRDIIRRIAK